MLFRKLQLDKTMLSQSSTEVRRTKLPGARVSPPPYVEGEPPEVERQPRKLSMTGVFHSSRDRRVMWDLWGDEVGSVSTHLKHLFMRWACTGRSWHHISMNLGVPHPVITP